MNRSSDTAGATERPCGLTALLPIGMSCRGRAEAFARRLQSRLRTLGTNVSKAAQPSPSKAVQSNSIDIFLFFQGTATNTETDNSENTWLTSQAKQSPTVTDHQPLANLSQEVADAYYDFDIPGSPIEECEYLRLVASAGSVTPPQETASESGYVCASPISESNTAVDHSQSSDEPFFDPENSDVEQRSLSLSIDYYDCDDLQKDSVASDRTGALLHNGHHVYPPIDNVDSDSCSESLPKSQSTTTSLSMCTIDHSSASNNTLQDDIDVTDFCQTVENGDGQSNGILAHELAGVDDRESSEKRVNGMADDVIVAEVNDCDPEVSETPTPTPQIEKTNHLNGHCSGDEDECVPRPQRLRRCSSLKTGKTPPGTPGRKKIVRFADMMGLDLADVRTFMDEIPKVPTSAYEDLQVTEILEPSISLGPRPEKILVLVVVIGVIQSWCMRGLLCNWNGRNEKSFSFGTLFILLLFDCVANGFSLLLLAGFCCSNKRSL